MEGKGRVIDQSNVTPVYNVSEFSHYSVKSNTQMKEI